MLGKKLHWCNNTCGDIHRREAWAGSLERKLIGCLIDLFYQCLIAGDEYRQALDVARLFFGTTKFSTTTADTLETGKLMNLLILNLLQHASIRGNGTFYGRILSPKFEVIANRNQVTKKKTNVSIFGCEKIHTSIYNSKKTIDLWGDIPVR